MIIKNISITGFRNLNVENLNLSPRINILHGMNAQGKTNCLEAMYFCAFGRPMRSNTDCDLINFNANTAHICTQIQRRGSLFKLDAHIQKQGSKAAKNLSIDHIPIKHMKELFGVLLVVMFAPEDLNLIKSGPAERRRFMDMEMCQLSPVYYTHLREYHRVLKQRNSLLKTMLKNQKSHRDESQEDNLHVWDDQLSKYGVKIMQSRAKFVTHINSIAQEIHNNITQGKEKLKLTYTPNINSADDYLEILSKSHMRDIMRGTTVNGIHKDDINFTINDISARNFGSQGQQRTAALSAKLAEIAVIKNNVSEMPILLLDDVLSELDKHRQQFLLTQISDIQTIITCTGLEDVLLTNKSKELGEYKIMHVENGIIYENPTPTKA